MDLTELVSGKIVLDGVEHNLVEIKHGGTGNVVWPLNLTYVIDASTVVISYSQSSNYIKASGANYCYATATVYVYQGVTLIETRTGAPLTPYELTGTYASHFTKESYSIVANNLGTTQVNTGTTANPQGYYCTASFVYQTSAPVEGYTIYQQYNLSTEGTPVKTYTGYGIGVSTSSFSSAGGTVTTSGLAYYTETPTYEWTSGSTSYGSPVSGSESATIDSLSISPSTGVVIAADYSSIIFPANFTSSAISYSVSGTVDGNATTISSMVHVAAYAADYSYANLTINTYSYEDVSAGGGSVRPTLEFSVDYYDNNVYQGTLTGTFTDGDTSITLTDGSHSVTAECLYQYKTGSSYYEDSTNKGLVSGSDLLNVVTARTSLGVRRVMLTVDSLSKYSEDVSVYQQANELGSTAYVSYSSWTRISENYNGNYRITEFSLDYDSVSNLAPFQGVSIPYTFTAAHSVYYTAQRDVYTDYRYTSWSSDNDDDNHRERTTTQETKEVTASQIVTGDSATFTCSADWITIDTTNQQIILAARTSGSTYRYAPIAAQNAGGGSYYTKTVYQNRYGEISVSPAHPLYYTADGGDKTLVISAANTTWALEYSNSGVTTPQLTFSTQEGGSDSAETTVNVTVTATARQDLLGSSFFSGVITLTPSHPDLSALTITVRQAPPLDSI